MREPWQKGGVDQALTPRKFLSLIDLGTASVKTLVVELRDGKVHLWGHGQSPLEGGFGPDGAIIDRETVIVACDAALSAAEEMTCDTFRRRIVPDRAIWSVPGWLCQGQTVVLQQRRPSPEKHISEREWWSLQTRLDRAVSSLDHVPIDVLSTPQVDDNTVTDAIGLRGKVLALQAFIISAGTGPLSILRKIAAGLELETPVFASQARAAAAGLGRDGLLLDMGRWGTHIVVVRLDRPVATTWVPMGGQSLYRTLANGFGLSPLQLSDFCQAYADGWLSPEVSAAADAALVDSVCRWLDLVAEQLGTLPADLALPHQLFLAGGASSLPAILRGARQYHWTQRLLWSRHPEIQVWEAFAVKGLIDHTSRRWDRSDVVRLGLARLALDIGQR